MKLRAERLMSLVVVAVASGLVGADRTAASEEPAASFVNVAGGKYTLPGPKDCKAVVLIFFGHDCPISNNYAPEINRLHKEYAAKDIDFCVEII